MEAAETVSKNLTDAGLDVLMDDRDERAGIKFNDADLIGIPVRLTIGSKTLKEGSVELKMRKSPEINLIKLDKVVEKISAIMRPAR